MIKKLLFLMLLGLSIHASDLYFGGEIKGAQNTLKGGINSDLRLSDVKGLIHLDYGEDGAFKYRVYLSYTHFSTALFDEKNQDLYGLGLELIKEFHAQDFIYPYVKLSLGFGQMALENAQEDKIDALLMAAGFGISFKTTSHLYFNTGFEYLAKRWQTIRYVSVTEHTLSSYSYGLGLFVGASYKF